MVRACSDYKSVLAFLITLHIVTRDEQTNGVLNWLTSQPHPDPSMPTVLAVISARQMSKDPKSLSMASRRSPVIAREQREGGSDEGWRLYCTVLYT